MSGHRDYLEHYESTGRAGWAFRLGAALLILFLWILPSPAALAQSVPEGPETRLALAGFDDRGFPTVALRMEAWDAQGNFLSGLKPDDVEVVEAGVRIRPERVEEVEVGLQFTLAVNLSPALGNHVQGASQYEHLRQALLRWARAQRSQDSDFSFATPTGLYLIHSNQPSEWSEALQAYRPDLAKMQPSLNSLAEALNLATETSEEETRRAILYITPALPANLEANLLELSQRAAELGVKVCVWLVAPASNAPLPSDHPLRRLAADTGGAFEQVYFPESKIDPDVFLNPLRKMYLIHYQSALRQSGDYPVKVQVQYEGQTLLSDARTFSVMVKPPNPIFLSPPAEVERAWRVPGGADAPAVLLPEAVELQILVEFPDAHPRALTGARLYMDGKLVAENTRPPYDRLIWPLSGVEDTGEHLLRVEVVDELGLSGTSTELPVEVRAPTALPKQLTGRILVDLNTRNLLILASVGISGAVLVMVLIFNDRRGKTARAETKSIRLNRRAARRAVTRAPSQGVVPALQHNGVIEASASPARLVSLNEVEQPIVGATIPIMGQEITIGSDPRRATQVIESPTVDGLHARIYRSENGCFFLADSNSVAGTWINYAPITVHGARLEHGDLVHIGRVMFRFELADPAQARTPQVKVIGSQDPIPLQAGDSK